MTQLLTHSRLSTFRACPRKHFLRYEIGLAAEHEDFALRVGTAFHAAQEAADLGQDPEAAITALGTLDAFDAAMTAAMFAVHREYWAGHALQVIATELQFEMPIMNPDTSHPSRVWAIGGKIDRIYQLSSGLLAVQDYKTTSEDIGPGSDLWLRLALDQQMSIYLLAARALGHDVQAILYDVTRRPMQRPLKATPIEERKYTQKPSKQADGTIRPAGSIYASQRETDETPEEFAARVAAEMRARPEHYFARHEIAKLDRDLDETAYDIWTQQLAMREAQRSGRWFRNPSHCERCEFLPVCGQDLRRDMPSAPSGFRILPDVHRELARPEQAGHAVGGHVPPGV